LSFWSRCPGRETLTCLPSWVEINVDVSIERSSVPLSENTGAYDFEVTADLRARSEVTCIARVLVTISNPSLNWL
jgi:hypothetical protein